MSPALAKGLVQEVTPGPGHVLGRDFAQIVGVLLLFLTLLLSACGQEQREPVNAKQPGRITAQGIQYGGHLKIGLATEPTSLDAILGRSGGDAYFWHQIFDQLVDANPDLTPRPETSLALRWEITHEPEAITFYLRPNVVFHDGSPFDAAAVKFNIERILDPKTLATPRASMTLIDSVDVVDELTVRFNLRSPWGAGLNMLADRGGVMNSPARVLELAKDYSWAPAGTGPFKVNKVITGTMVHLVRNENYWGRDEHGNSLPYLDEVTIRVIRDETVLSSALRTGEVDVAYLPKKDVSAFQRDERFQIRTMEGGGIGAALIFNLAQIADPNLRLAISHAVDPSVINQAIFFNRNTMADSGMWPTGAWAHDDDVTRPTYDPEKARALLLAAGKDEFTFTAVTNNSSTLILTAEVVRAMLKKVGINMEIEVMNAGVATERFFHGESYPVYLTTWSRYPEPDWLASLAYKSDGFYNAANLPRPDVDELVARGAASYDLATRREVYHELNALILKEAWFVPLLYSTTYAAAPQKVRNLDRLIGWDGKMFLRELWLEQN